MAPYSDSLQDIYIDQINKLTDKLEIKEFEVDYWRIRWAQETGISGFWASVAQKSWRTDEEFTAKNKKEGHESAIAQLRSGYEAGLKKPDISVLDRVYYERKLNQIERMHL